MRELIENRVAVMENRALDSNSTPQHSTEEKGKETTEQLYQKYMKLEQDWNDFKESRSTTSRKYCSPLTTITNPIFQQTNNFISPKELMSSLQRESSSSEVEKEEPWNDFYHVEVKEILEERREAFETGRLKGRRLFDSSTESESDHELEEKEENNNNNNNNNNVVSQSEVRSMSFSYSGDEDEDEDEHEDEHENENENENELLGSSLSPPPIGDFVDKDMVTNAADIKVGSYKSRFVNGTRYGVFLGGFVVFVLLIVASLGHDSDVYVVPT